MIFKTFATHALIFSFGLASSAAYANLGALDSLLLDFSQNSEPTTSTDDPNGTWNNITTPGDDRFAPVGTSADPILSATDLVRYSDGSATGVSLSMIATSSGQSGISSANVPADPNAIFTASGLIPLSAQTDFLWGAKVRDFQPPTSISFVFNGLDNSLNYNLEFQAWTDVEDRNPKTIVAQQGESSEASLLVDSNDSPSVYAFNGLSTNGNGQISLTLTDLGKGANRFNINAMALTAIPEVNHFALSAGIAAFMAISRRKRTVKHY